MTLTHAERVERYRNEMRRRLGDLGISVAEYAILNHIHFGCHRPRHLLAKFAACPDYALGESINRREAARAVGSCFKRGFLRVITQSDLKNLKRELTSGGYLGPIYGYPPPGGVDFTDLGAELWLALEKWEQDNLPDSKARGFAYLDVVEIRTRWTFVSQAGMNCHRRQLCKEPDFREMTVPTRLDQVRLAEWSQPIPGWTFDVTEQLKWQGRAGGGGAFLNWDAEITDVDLPLVRRECRRLRITLSEVCVLMASAEEGAHGAGSMIRHAMGFATRAMKVRCDRGRIINAVRSCLKKKWLVKMTDDEMRRFVLRRDSTLPPLVSRNPQLDSLGLSETGAKFLAEQGPRIFGTAWLDGWTVSREIFRREHRYARNFRDLAAVFEEYANKSEVRVQISSIGEIGPWCVYWWKRFPQGYRVELEITVEGVE